jgi:hypothetical protein
MLGPKITASAIVAVKRLPRFHAKYIWRLIGGYPLIWAGGLTSSVMLFALGVSKVRQFTAVELDIAQNRCLGLALGGQFQCFEQTIKRLWTTQLDLDDRL